MRYGIMLGADRKMTNVEAIASAAEQAELAGFDSVWMAHIRALDAISALTVAATRTNRIELGTAVTPIYPRHPMALAQQALTAAQVAAGRFTLGVGVSHKPIVEGMLGLCHERPARYMREYLAVLLPLLQGQAVDFSGAHFKVRGLQIDIPDAGSVPVVVAALGPVMLALAGRLSDGTNTWMTGPDTLRKHVAKHLNAAAAAAGRALPRIVAGFPVVVTRKADSTRARLASELAVYGQLPSYRAMLDREGARGPEDIALIGDEQHLANAVQRLEDAGVTDFNAAIMTRDEHEYRRTFDCLASLRARAADA